MGDSQQSKSDHQRREKTKNTEQKVDESKNCLYVGNLSYRVDNSVFRAEFEKYGDLEYANIVYQPGQKSQQMSRGYGFVKFKNEEDAIAAHKGLNRKEIYGKEWVIQFSKRDKPRVETPGRYLGQKKRQHHRNDYDSRRYERKRSYSPRSPDHLRRERRRSKDSRQKQRRRQSRERKYSPVRQRGRDDKDRDLRREKQRSRDREYERRRYRQSQQRQRNQRRRRSRSNSYNRRR